MRNAQLRRQFKATLRNVESALDDLSERLDMLPGGNGRRGNAIERAGRRLRHTAGTMADHVPLERASAIATETGRTLRQHPVITVATAAIAGYCVWSLIRWSNDRSHAERVGRQQDTDDTVADQLRHGAEPGQEAEQYARH